MPVHRGQLAGGRRCGWVAVGMRHSRPVIRVTRDLRTVVQGRICEQLQQCHVHAHPVFAVPQRGGMDRRGRRQTIGTGMRHPRLKVCIPHRVPASVAGGRRTKPGGSDTFKVVSVARQIGCRWTYWRSDVRPSRVDPTPSFRQYVRRGVADPKRGSPRCTRGAGLLRSRPEGRHPGRVARLAPAN